MPGGDPVRLELRHAGGATPIVVGSRALAAAAGELAAALAGGRIFLVASRPLWELHGGALAGLDADRLHRLEIADGEAAKELESAARLWREMLAAGGKRDSRVVAFGGGSVSDLAGFAAGAFLRGVPWVALPTTLLAQVDAAIGGKTGVNLPQAKNSVGLFHQPVLVVCDTSLLATLPAAELRSGLLEAVKMAALFDLELLAGLERDLEELLEGAAEPLAGVVAAAARAKIAVVERDPLDRGERRALNFGHTLAHALETAAGYGGLRHGEAVGYGMLFALRLARGEGMPREETERLRELVARFALPPLPALAVDELLAIQRRDKKAREGGLEWVLPERLGGGAGAHRLSEEAVARELARFLADPLS